MTQQKKLTRFEKQGIRYLTFSVYRRLALFEEQWLRDEFARRLEAARVRCGFRLIAWVLMPEHVHLILVPRGEWTVPRILRAIKQPVGQLAMRRWRESDSVWMDRLRTNDGRRRFWQAGGGFDRNVRDQQELVRAVAYVHRNPVERGMVERDEDWLWSSARWYSGDRSGVVSVDRVEI